MDQPMLGRAELGQAIPRTEDAKALWPGGDVGRPPEADWAVLRRDDAVRAAALAVLRRKAAS